MCSVFAVKDPNLKPYALGTVEAGGKNNNNKTQQTRTKFLSICFTHQVNNSLLSFKMAKHLRDDNK